METQTIYVVMGTTGEYSDRTEWPVVAFCQKDTAEKLIEQATKRAKEIEATREERYYVERGCNEFDPDMTMDYTGTYYFLYEVELR
jgi:hypothetical protein